MKHVIDIDERGTDADVLTETGGGLIKRSLLKEEPLAAHLDDDEEPQYVLRNKKQGFTIDRPDGTEEYGPIGRYSGLSVVSDVRVLFVVGGRDKDRTVSVDMADVAAVHADDGVLGGVLVLETGDDVAYRFPCKGDLDDVVEYLDAATGIWRSAHKRVERAEQQLDKLREFFDSGDVDVVLAAVGEVRETLDAARDEAAPLPAARDHVDERADGVEERLATLERRAYAEQAEQARERAHVRWDDHEYEAAFDHLDDAADAYESAATVDGDEPDDALLERRQETLDDERARLASAPVERAEHAVEVATAAENPDAAIDWWETAIERYETALSLDWGREKRRFDGDPDDLREQLADIARNLVGAYCDLARDHLEGDEADEADADPADLAREALAQAEDVARERAPGALETVERVEEAIEADSAGESNAEADSADEDTDTEADPAGADVAASTRTVVENAPDSESGKAPAVNRRTHIDPGDTGGPADMSSNGSTGSREEAPREDGNDDGEPDVVESVPESASERADESGVGDPGTVDSERFTALVAAVFREAGWTATLFETSREGQYDLLAETDDPVGVTACVWTCHPETVEAVDAARIERYAAHLSRADEGDAAVVCSAAPLSPTARERAREYDVKLLGPDSLRERVADSEVTLSAYR